MAIRNRERYVAFSRQGLSERDILKGNDERGNDDAG
jgi:hypothetical protein